MGVKSKGGMYCERCGPVPGQKTTHRARGTMGIVGSLVSLGALGLATPDPYHCPNCGGFVEPAWMHEFRKKRGM